MFNLKTSIAATALALAGAAHAAGPNLVADGTFAGATGSFSTYGAVSTIDNAWTVSNGSVDLIGSYWTAPTGYSIDLDGNAPGTISQGLNLAAGQYTVSFALAGNFAGGDATKAVQVSIDGVTHDYTFVTTGHSAGAMGWETKSFTFDVTNPAALSTLTFTSLDAGGYYGAALADISVTAVPEPASLGLLLAGLGMLGVVSSRRRAH